MSKKKRSRIESEERSSQQLPEDAIKQNSAPTRKWKTFEQCWASCVKNGKDIYMQSCKAHIRSKGLENQPDKWIDAMKEFGIEIEK